jgi:hypothetical protein
MDCPKCGAFNPDGSTYCDLCFFKFEGPPQAPGEPSSIKKFFAERTDGVSNRSFHFGRESSFITSTTSTTQRRITSPEELEKMGLGTSDLRDGPATYLGGYPGLRGKLGGVFSLQEDCFRFSTGGQPEQAFTLNLSEVRNVRTEMRELREDVGLDELPQPGREAACLADAPTTVMLDCETGSDSYTVEMEMRKNLADSIPGFLAFAGMQAAARASQETRQCPFCAETIKKAAVKCRYCGSDLPPVEH